MECDAILNAYYDHRFVNCDDRDRIAKRFIEQVTTFATRIFETQLTHIPLNELRVFCADSYEFMMVFVDREPAVTDYQIHEWDPEVESPERLVGYHRLMVEDRLRQRNATYKNILTTWEDGYYNYDCISAGASIKEFQQMLQHYKQSIKKKGATYPTLPGVAEIKMPRVGSPEVKVILTRADEDEDEDEDEIIVTMYPTVRIMHYGEEKFFIAKRPSFETNLPNEDLESLWLRRFSNEEEIAIEPKTSVEIKNYKILISLFKEFIPHEYVWKMVFLNINTNGLTQSSPSKFLVTMISHLEGALYQELRNRGHGDVTTDLDRRFITELTPLFNRDEKVLERYNDTELWKWIRFMTDFRDLVVSNPTKFFMKVIGKQLYEILTSAQ